MATTTRTLRVGNDVDGVHYPFVDTLRLYSADRLGIDISTMPDAECWDFMTDQWGWTVSEFLERYAAGVLDGHIFWTGDPMDGSAAGMRRLADAGHHIVVVTSRAIPGVDAELAATATAHWFDTHQIPYHELHISSDKTGFDTDIFIEDHVVNYDALEAAGENPYLITRPWNAHRDDVRRVATIDEFCDIVDRLAAAPAAA
jgi:hypothetical protein